MRRRSFLKASLVAPVVVGSSVSAEPISDPKLRETMFWSKRFQRLYHVEMAEGVEIEFDGHRFIVNSPNRKPIKYLVVSQGLSCVMWADVNDQDPLLRMGLNGKCVEYRACGVMLFRIREVKKDEVPAIFNKKGI
jgi:hypothetical protein